MTARTRGRPARLLLTLGALLLLALSGGQASARSDANWKAHARTAKSIAKDVDRLFKRAKSKKLGIQAAEMAKILVHFHSDHEEARSWLGDTKEDEAWKAPEDPPAREDEDEEALAAFEKQRDRKLGELARKLWRMHDKLTGEKHEEARNFLLEDIAVLTPEDPRLTEERTVFLEGGHWLTIEVLTSRTVDEVLDTIRSRIIENRPAASKIGLHDALKKAKRTPWRSMLRVGDIAIWGVCSEEEVKLLGMCAELAFQLMEHSWGGPLPPKREAGLVMIDNIEDRARFAREMGLPHMAHMGAYALPKVPIFVTAKRLGFPFRADAGVRLLVDAAYRVRFGDGGDWMRQGVGVAMVHKSVNTRLTILGNDPGEVDAEERRLGNVLYDGKTSWWTEALRLINDDKLDRNADLQTQSTGDIWVRELLSCYAHASHLLYGYPQQAPIILKRLSNGDDAAAVYREELGWDSLDVVHAKLKRFLNDSATYQEGISQRVAASGQIPRSEK